MSASQAHALYPDDYRRAASKTTLNATTPKVRVRVLKPGCGAGAVIGLATVTVTVTVTDNACSSRARPEHRGAKNLYAQPDIRKESLADIRIPRDYLDLTQ